VIIDNEPSVEYFRRELGAPAERLTYIPYGADLTKPEGTEFLEELGVEPRSYIVFVGALVPDKGPDVLLDAYKRVAGHMPLVVVGDTPFAPEYKRALHAAAADDPRVRMAGYIYGDRYRQLVANAYAYVHPPRNEGTSPALLQAMAFGNCVVASDIPEALKVVGEAAITFSAGDPDDLARQLDRVLTDEALVEEMRGKALRRVRERYSWDEVAAAHRSVYEGVLRRPSR
jgi:glycosyltransferase involved in cell wall biosynthesis